MHDVMRDITITLLHVVQVMTGCNCILVC